MHHNGASVALAVDELHRCPPPRRAAAWCGGSRLASAGAHVCPRQYLYPKHNTLVAEAALILVAMWTPACLSEAELAWVLAHGATRQMRVGITSGALVHAAGIVHQRCRRLFAFGRWAVHVSPAVAQLRRLIFPLWRRLVSCLCAFARKRDDRHGLFFYSVCVFFFFLLPPSVLFNNSWGCTAVWYEWKKCVKESEDAETKTKKEKEFFFFFFARCCCCSRGSEIAKREKRKKKPRTFLLFGKKKKATPHFSKRK